MAVDIHVSVAWLCGKRRRDRAGRGYCNMRTSPSSGYQALACLRNSVRSALLQSGTALILFSFKQNFGLLLHVGHEVGRPARLDFNPRQRLGKGVFRYLESL